VLPTLNSGRIPIPILIPIPYPKTSLLWYPILPDNPHKIVKHQKKINKNKQKTFGVGLKNTHVTLQKRNDKGVKKNIEKRRRGHHIRPKNFDISMFCTSN